MTGVQPRPKTKADNPQLQSTQFDALFFLQVGKRLLGSDLVAVPQIQAHTSLTVRRNNALKKKSGNFFHKGKGE